MPTDEELLDAWRAGQRAAGQSLVERHNRSLYAFFVSKAAENVDELLQRTWLACTESRVSFRGEGTFRGFLFGIARHELFGYFRRARRDRGAFDPGSQSVADLATSPSQLVARKREHALMYRAMRAVSLDDQIVLELFFWEELGGAELGQVLGVSEAAARSRLARARGRLADKMAELSDSAEVLSSVSGDLEGWATSLRAWLREAEGI